MTIKIRGEEYYLVEDLARILPISENTVRQYLREGRIRGQKLGVLWYVSNQNLRAFLERGSRDVVRLIKSKVES
jgi:excisionase family DNA binding protein